LKKLKPDFKNLIFLAHRKSQLFLDAKIETNLKRITN